jgi:hypothetical protein
MTNLPLPATAYETDPATITQAAARAAALDRDQPVNAPTPGAPSDQSGTITTASADRPAGFDPLGWPNISHPQGRTTR